MIKNTASFNIAGLFLSIEAEALLPILKYQVLSPTSNLHLGQDANSLHFGDINADLYSQIDPNDAYVKDLNQKLATLFEAISVHTRTMILYVLQPSAEKTEETLKSTKNMYSVLHRTSFFHSKWKREVLPSRHK